jgi:LuxR family transcriptional regulator
MSPQVEIGDSLAALKALAPAGYAIALHVRFTTPLFLFQTYPPKWIEYYSKNGLVMRDPTVHWGFENTGVKPWDELVGDDPAGVISAAAEHGMKHGVTIAIDEANSRTIASFARSDRAFLPEDIAQVMDSARKLHASTAEAETLLPETRERLRKMSILFTHP